MNLTTDRVSQLLREAAATYVLPRFCALADGEVTTKSGPNDYVTIADREAEEFLTAQFQAALPGVLVVGEEATTADGGSALAQLASAEHAFVVDPVDGTRNFVLGNERFGLMVAEVRRGETTRAWIYQPVLEHLYVAELGGGVTRDDERLAPAVRTRPYAGCASKKTVIGRSGDGVKPVSQTSWASAVDYPRVCTGEWDFIAYDSGNQWDHLPGSLMVRELGGVTVLGDGRQAGASIDDMRILIAGSPEVADTVRDLVFAAHW